MAGYSGTPLPKKLGIKEGHRVVLVDAPDQIDELLGDLPPAVTLLRSARRALSTWCCCSSRSAACSSGGFPTWREDSIAPAASGSAGRSARPACRPT